MGRAVLKALATGATGTHAEEVMIDTSPMITESFIVESVAEKDDCDDVRNDQFLTTDSGQLAKFSKIFLCVRWLMDRLMTFHVATRDVTNEPVLLPPPVLRRYRASVISHVLVPILYVGHRSFIFVEPKPLHIFFLSWWCGRKAVESFVPYWYVRTSNCAVPVVVLSSAFAKIQRDDANIHYFHISKTIFSLE